MQQYSYTDNLKRDKDGHRVGLKILIRRKVPMSKDGWNRWGRLQKIHIYKSKFVWKYYGCSRKYYPDGVPLEYLKTDSAFAVFLINNFLLENDSYFAVHGWAHKRTKFRRSRRGVGFTKKIFEIHVYDAELLKFKIVSSKLNRYWFRREEKQRKQRMWGDKND